ncbi:MAG: YbaB/EbfC family nucleoid-associated protein [Dehalococcoidia bacterium]|nr:YbaB/EbfC family nucleoid-associated protein [Dehalococcoidia bacterium]
MMARLSQMQEQMAKAQEEIENRVAEATSGGGAVKVEITGGYKIKSLKIDPDAVDPDDLGMLEDLVIAAFNEALEKVQGFHSENLGALNIPGLDLSGGGGGPPPPINRAARRAGKR